LIGANGQLGHELRFALASLGEVTALTRPDLDLSDASHLQANIEQVLETHHPEVIVNAAAYTAVDKAESEPELAAQINAHALQYLAEAANASGACLVHYSTDYVFAGDKPLTHQYVETDTPNPQSVYGRTKLLGEQLIAQYCPKHLIFRTSWVLGQHGGNFLKTMLRLAQDRDQLQVVSDQWGAPTSAALIAQTTTQVLTEMLAAPADDSRWGIYHLVAAGAVTWHQYAHYVISKAREAGLAIKINPQAISPINTKDYPVAAMRPLNSQLNTDKIRQNFGIVLPNWQMGVDMVLKQVLATMPLTTPVVVQQGKP
jgi:dTDP-4-dehydrorhamnose reductase